LSEKVVAALNAPEFPVTVTVTGPPSVATLLAESVNTWVPAAVPAAKLAVTPLGNPVADSVTDPVNPPRSATEIVLVPLPFCATDTLVGDADNVKLGGTIPVSVKVAAGETPLTVAVTVNDPPLVGLAVTLACPLLLVVPVAPDGKLTPLPAKVTVTPGTKSPATSLTTAIKGLEKLLPIVAL
jgi:hypothetical protein